MIVESEMRNITLSPPTLDNNSIDGSPFVFEGWDPVTRVLDSVQVIDVIRTLAGTADEDTQRDSKALVFPMTESAWQDCIHARVSAHVNPQLQTLFMAELEKRIERKMGRIVNFYYGRSGDKMSDVDMSKAQNLPMMVHARLEEIEKRKKDIAADRERMYSEMETLAKTSLDSLKLLDRILVTFKSGLEVQRHQVYANYFLSVIVNISRKLQCLNAQLRLDVFAGPRGAAVIEQRERLHQQQRQLEIRLRQASQSLYEFSAAGSEFAAVAALYARLCHEAETIKDDIKRIEMA